MKKATHYKYTAFLLPLLWLQQPACAENLSTVARQYEYTLPAPPVKSSHATAESVRSIQQQEYAKKREALNQQSILIDGKRLALTPQLLKIKQLVDALLHRPDDLEPLEILQQQAGPLQDYIERQFYNTKNLSQQKNHIILFALILGDKAVQPMISWSAQFKDSPQILQSIIKGLAYLKPTIEIRQFIDTLLDNSLQYPEVIRSALYYYTVWPDDSARRWVSRYRYNNTLMNSRHLVFYLAALLGDESVLSEILKLLEKKPPIYQRYYLQLALSYLVNLEQYQQLTSGLELNEQAADSILRQIQFRQSVFNEREQLLQPMLSSYYEEERRLAFNHLLEMSNTEKIRSLMTGPETLIIYRRVQQAGIVLNQIQPAAIKIAAGKVNDVGKDTNASATSTNSHGVFLPLVVLGVVTLLAGIFLLLRRTGITRVKQA